MGKRHKAVVRGIFFLSFSAGLSVSSLSAGAPDESKALISEESLRDAILERQHWGAEELEEMDLNVDGRLDSADLVNYTRRHK
jgi:hypothetical protein